MDERTRTVCISEPVAVELEDVLRSGSLRAAGGNLRELHISERAAAELERALHPRPAAQAAGRELVRKLIPELVAEALNGHARPTAVQPAALAPTGTATQPSAKTCRVCGRSAPDARFDADRRTCRTCRATQQRARKQADAREADQPANPEPAAPELEHAEVVERAAT